MPIGSTNVYYPGDLILSTVSSSGTSFIETKIVASTSSLIYFDNNARINSASLSSFTFGSSSYSLTASYVNISSSNVFVQGGNSFGTTAILGTNDASALSFETNGSTRATIDTNGNLGIGTTSPAGLLEVYASNNGGLGGYLVLNNNGNAVANETALIFGDGASTARRAAISSTTENSPYYGDLKFKTGASAYSSLTTRMIIKGDGNVGIGTTSPVNKLDVAGNISCSVMSSSFAYLSNIGFTNQITSSDTTVFPTGSTSGGFILDGGIYTNGLYRTRFVKIDRSANLPLYIQETQGSSGSFANLVRFGTHANSPNTFEVFGRTNIQGSITSSNFVGPHIGNTTGTASWATNALTASFLPVGTYNITSSWANNSISASYAVTASYVNISSSNVFLQGGNSFGTTALLGTNDAQPLVFETSGSERMRIVSDGNVGIGTSNPIQKLHVSSGNILLDNTYAIYAKNTVGSLETVLYGRFTDNAAYLDGGSGGLYLRSNNNTALYINPSGNLGVGGFFANNKMVVSGSVSIGDGTYNTAGPTNGLIVQGNVGIGTTSPFSGAELDVYGDIVLANQNWSLRGNNGNGDFAIEELGASFNDSNIKFYIVSGGNVGIGTIVPTQKLEVQGNVQIGNDNVTNVGLKLTRLNGGFRTSEHTFHSSQNSPWYTYGQNLTWTNELAGTVEPTQAYRPYFEGFVPAVGYKVFGFMNVNTGSFTSANVVNSLVLKNDGNVGIGTTNPAFLLDVSGSSRHGFTSTNTHQFTGSVSLSDGLSLTNLTASNISASGNIIASRITSSNVLINGNLTVTGSIFASLFSASYIYITSSQLVVTDNIITLNALSPYQRYAGIEMYDSGSGNLSSFLWDGQGDYFFVTGSGVNSKIIVGPDQQTNLTSGRLTKATGTNIIGDSIVSDDGSGITVAGYISGSSVMTTNITCSNISASKTGSFGIVGIGTSSPISKLEVSGGYITAGNRTSPQGAIILQGAYDTGNIVVFGSEYSSGGPFLGYGVSPSTASAASFFSSTPASNLGRMAYVQGSDTHRWYVGPTQTVSVGVTASLNEAMRINSAGYVGIGTTNPLSLLELYAKPALTSSLLTMLTINTDLTSSSGTGFGGSITFRGRTAGNLLQDNAQISAYNENINDNGYALGFYTRPTVAAGLIQRVTILRGGNVGIGTTSPAQSLDVSGSIRIRSAGTYSDPTDNAGFLNYDSIGGIFTISARSNSGNTFMAFRTSNGGSASEIMRIDNNGNVGIGTSSPGYKLDVLGDLRISGSTSTIGTFKSSASNCFISLIDSSGDNVFLGNDDGDFLIQTPTSAYSTKLIVKDDGNVGIGTTVPAFLLDVSGSSRHGFTSTNVHQFTGSVSISGSVNLAGSFVYDNAVLLDFGRTTTPAISTNYVVLQNITGSYNAAFFDYFASSGSNFRAGTVIAGWSGSSINYTEYSTTDIGNTNQLTMSVDLSSSFVRLLTTVSTTTNWNIKSSGRYL